jgi:hypothetical protein
VLDRVADIALAHGEFRAPERRAREALKLSARERQRKRGDDADQQRSAEEPEESPRKV